MGQQCQLCMYYVADLGIKFYSLVHACPFPPALVKKELEMEENMLGGMHIDTQV